MNAGEEKWLESIKPRVILGLSSEEVEQLIIKLEEEVAKNDRIQSAMGCKDFECHPVGYAEAREAALVDMLADIQPILINARGWCPKDSAAESDIIRVVKQINELLIVKKKT